MLNSAADRIKEYKDKFKKWQKEHPKPKSNLDKAIDFVTKPLVPSLKQAQKESEQNDKGVAMDGVEAKKHDVAHARSLANKMRSSLSAEVKEQRASGSVAPSPGVVAHVKVAKGEGQGR